MMYDSNILNWIKSKLSMGLTKDQINNYLIQQGYSKEQIEEMFSQLTPEFNKQPEKKNNFNKKLVLFTVFGLLFLFLSFLIGLFVGGLILTVIFGIYYIVEQVYLSKRPINFKIAYIIIFCALILLFLIFLPQQLVFRSLLPLLLFTLSPMIILVLYYYFTNKDTFFGDLTLAVLTSFFASLTLFLLLVYVSGITIFNLFGPVYTGYAYLYLSFLGYLCIIAFFKFKIHIFKFFNVLPTKEKNAKRSVIKISTFVFVIMFIILSIIVSILGIQNYNSFIEQADSQINNIKELKYEEELIPSNTFLELKQTTIYKEANSYYRDFYTNFHSINVPSKTNTQIILDYFNGRNFEDTSYLIKFLVIGGIERAQGSIISEIMLEENQYIEGSSYNVSFNRSSNSYREYMYENYYLDYIEKENETLVPLSKHINNLNLELSKIRNEKNSNSNTEDSLDDSSSFVETDTPLNFFTKPMVSNLYLRNVEEELATTIVNITSSAPNRYTNINHSESDISRMIRLSMILDREPLR